MPLRWMNSALRPAGKRVTALPDSLVSVRELKVVSKLDSWSFAVLERNSVTEVLPLRPDPGFWGTMEPTEPQLQVNPADRRRAHPVQNERYPGKNVRDRKGGFDFMASPARED